MSYDSMWTRKFSRLFALIIGINEYESPLIPPLHSAIHDATRYRHYLVDYLGVPTHQINMLLGKDASREAIVKSFKSLGDDPRIDYGDPIFIVYTGHGSEDDPPPGWDEGTQPSCIQVLVPQDYCAVPGSEVPYIPDRTIGDLLEYIAGKKGNNITVIMDCCHSASGTRGANLQARSVVLRPRNMHPSHPTRGIDKCGPPRPSAPSPLSTRRFRGLQSHILIAACGLSEVALESRSYGQFSNALMRLLRSTPPDQLRYSQILGLLKPIQGQNPQIEGFNLDRLLFGVEPSERSPLPVARYALGYDKQSNAYFIRAGKAHGVTNAYTFDLLDSNGINVGSLAVKKALLYHSFVEFTDPVFIDPAPDLLSAIIVETRKDIHPYRIRLYVIPSQRHQAPYKDIRSLVENGNHDLNVCLVDQPDQADLEVSVGQSTLKFHLAEKRFIEAEYRHPFTRVASFEQSKIISYLNAASRYLWELHRHNDDGDFGSTLMDDVDVSIYPLQEKLIAFTEKDLRMELMPLNDEDLCENGEVDLVIKPDVCYGVKITNNSDRDLFPKLVFFDCRDLTKPATCYEPFNSGPYTLDPPLRKEGGCLTIGYGSGGMPPLEFNLEDGEDFSIGYLKLFIFTQPLHVFRAPNLPANSDFSHHTFLTEDTWGTRVIPIILRRHPKPTMIVHVGRQVPRVGVLSMVRTCSLPN